MEVKIYLSSGQIIELPQKCEHLYVENDAPVRSPITNIMEWETIVQNSLNEQYIRIDDGSKIHYIVAKAIVGISCPD